MYVWCKYLICLWSIRKADSSDFGLRSSKFAGGTISNEEMDVGWDVFHETSTW